MDNEKEIKECKELESEKELICQKVNSDCLYNVMAATIAWNPGNLLIAPNDKYRLGDKPYP